MKTSFFISTLFCCAILHLHADDKSLVLQGKLVYENSFSAAPDSKWHTAKGLWESVDSSLRGSEKPEDKHASVTRLPLNLKDFIIELECKLDGGKMCSLSINDSKGHFARIIITPTVVTIKRDDHDHEGPDKAVTFAAFPVDYKTGVWHKVRLEMVGDGLLGKVDELSAFGSDALFTGEKANVGLVVGGKSVDFRNFKVWEATKNPDFKAPPTGPKPTPIKAKAKPKSE